MLKDTKKATNSQWISCLKFYYFRNIPTFQQRKRIRHVLSYSPLIPGVKKYTSTDTRSLSCDEQPPIQFRY